MCEGQIKKSVPRITVWHHEESLSYTPFISERRFFNNAVTSIADVRHIDDTTVAFNDVIAFSDVNLNYGVRDIHYNQCISKHVSILEYYLTLGRIT